MLKKEYNKFINLYLDKILVSSSSVLLVVFIITAALFFIAISLSVNTDISRLLPGDDEIAPNQEEINIYGGGNPYFSVLLEHTNQDTLKKAVESTVADLKEIRGVETVEYKTSKDFVKEYKYLLLSIKELENLKEEIAGWKSKVKTADSLRNETQQDSVLAGLRTSQQIERLIQHYDKISDYYQNYSGNVFGIMIYLKPAYNEIGEIETVYHKIERLADSTEEAYNIWAGISGSHIDEIQHYNIIKDDLNNAAILAGILILIILLFSIRNIFAVIAALLPLAAGLIWSFALVKIILGDINLISSFLILVLLGIGIDYTIHIMKRYRRAKAEMDPEAAIRDTFTTSGSAVILSALTSFIVFVVLAFSDFNGFSEFGFISALSVIMMVLVIFLLLPPLLMYISRWNLIKKAPAVPERAFLPGKVTTVIISLIILASGVYGFLYLKFNPEISNEFLNQTEIMDLSTARDKQQEVFSGTVSSDIVYLAPDFESLDATLKELRKFDDENQYFIHKITSARDFIFNERIKKEKDSILNDIKELAEGNWKNSLEDSIRTTFVKDLESWEIPDKIPETDTIPESLLKPYKSSSGNYFLVNVFLEPDIVKPSKRAETLQKLGAITLPPNVKGPLGSIVIHNRITDIVLNEIWWIAIVSFVLIFLLIWLFTSSVRDTIFALTPLVAGLLLSLGILELLSFELTIYNIMVIPVLMGLGIDGGLYYIRRWHREHRNTFETQKEIKGPIATSLLTTATGFAGMFMASHYGLQSIAIFAVTGLTGILIATLLLLPGLLHWYNKVKMKKENM